MRDAFDGKEIKKIIKARRLTVKDLAETIGIHPNTLSSALNGNRDLGRAVRLSLYRELNLDPEALRKKAS